MEPLQNTDSREKSFDQKKSNELIISMPLDSMFVDTKIRELAKYAGKGNISGIQSLIDQGVDVNSRGNQGVTPLFWALRRENLAGFKKLLESGADPNITFASSSIIHWASRLKDTRFLEVALANNGDPNLYAGHPQKTPIFNTISVDNGENLAALKLLLDAGADIDAKTGNEMVFGMSMGGITPVLAAADIVRYDIVLILLEAGAQYETTDDTGRDLISRIKAVQNRFSEGATQKASLDRVIKWLEEKGVKL
ncbi:ankyrin repeat domain-containing protein [Alteromonas sp. A081]|uniref:ankyrin repeat domain-containing protein n=1 Tax=Alteromonas sp. A081 TaxID=3410269 RepID=UPI003B9839D0